MSKSPLHTRRRGQDDQPKRDSMLPLRNWLNIIFMLGSVIGVLVYYFSDHTIGTIIVLAAMIFKMVESALRFIR